MSSAAFQAIVHGTSNAKEPRTKAKRKTPELDAQKAVIRWRDLMLCKYPELKWLAHNNNGLYTASMKLRRDAKEAGVVAGYPDLHLAVVRNGVPGLFIEMKSPEGSLSKEQKDWRDHLLDQGYAWHLCRSSHEAIKVIEQYITS